MYLEKFLTEYDENLSGESYIDPLGMLVIWSEFGRKIFKNRVNSIANDVRNYTLNLFNHYLIRRLVQDDSILLNKAMELEYRGKDSVQFKNTCLVYLENLFVYSILLEQESDKRVDSGAVLGIVKARRLWNEHNKNPILKLTHDSSGHILVRQLSLGVSGRYKTPMVEMGYFDGNYHYNMPKSVELWNGVDDFIKKTPLLKHFSEEIYEHIKSVLAQSKLAPEIQFISVPESLHKNYGLAFASSGTVGQYAKNYWLKVTGLDTGAAGALMQVLDENSKKNPPSKIDDRELISLAKKNISDNVEKIKMHQIEVLEPFLADATLLFILLTTKKTQPMSDVVTMWERFDRNENTLRLGALRVLDNPDVISSLSGTAARRLNALLKLSSVSSFQDQITLLIEYHRNVMEWRGQYSWLGISDNNLLKVQARPSSPPDFSKWKVGCWVNNYYIPQFKFLVSGFQGRDKA